MYDLIKDLAGELKDNATLSSNDFWDNIMEKSFDFIEKNILTSKSDDDE